MTYINLDLECRVDKDADGRITEEEIKEVQYKIINSPLTVQTFTFQVCSTYKSCFISKFC